MKRNYQIVKKDRQGLDAIKVPTSLDVAWSAGLYEGEGSCVASGTRGTSFSVAVTQKDPELLYWLRDWFGGGVNLYNVGKKKRFKIYHWVVCGDKARVFLGCIYPFLTSRRKAQIESTSASTFLDAARDVIRKDVLLGTSLVYASLWEKLHEIDAEQRRKAHEHKLSYQKEYWSDKSQDPEYRESKRIAQQQRRQEKIERNKEIREVKS